MQIYIYIYSKCDHIPSKCMLGKIDAVYHNYIYYQTPGCTDQSCSMSRLGVQMIMRMISPSISAEGIKLLLHIGAFN